jgi:hypothetical protein
MAVFSLHVWSAAANRAKRTGTNVAFLRAGDNVMLSPSIAVLIKRVQDAFLDVSGLSMTVEQAQRLFRIDRATCQALFDALMESAVVTRKSDGTFVAHAA